MSFLDIAIVIVYLIVLVIIGFVASRGIKTHEDSVVAGRSFGSFTAAVGKAANIAGGSTSVGGTGYGYTYGVSGTWFGLSNVLANFIAAPLCKRIWNAMYRGKFVTIAEYLGYRFGKTANFLTNLLNMFAYMGFVASQVVATGTICHIILGWDFNVAMLITTAVVVCYTLTGGLKAVVYTDYMQLFVLYAGLVFVLFPMSLTKVGGWGVLTQQLPEAFSQMGSMGWFTIIGVILIPTALNSFTMQAFYGYMASCKNEKAAWQSSIITGILYFFPAMAVVVIGMCAYFLDPSMASGQEALPTMIMKLLPTGIIGLVFAAIIAATMSTSDTCLLSSTMCFTNIYKGFIKKDATDQDMLKMTKISMAVIGVIVLGIATFYPNIIKLILLGYSIGVGGLLVPVFATMFWKRATTAGCISAMVCGGISYVVLANTVTWPPLFLSLPLSAAAMIIVSLATKAPNPSCYDVYFDDEWEKTAI